MTAVIRSAKTSDVKKIRTIIDTYAVERKLLSKETVTLFESVQEFSVAVEGNEVVGCGAAEHKAQLFHELRSKRRNAPANEPPSSTFRLLFGYTRKPF